MAETEGKPDKSPVDIAIERFRAAHREWDRAIPHVGVSISALDAQGNGFTIDYRLPSGDGILATSEQCAAYGFTMVSWSSLPQPVLAPTNDEWRAAYDKCCDARAALAHAAEALAAAVTGNDNSARNLRGGAERLAIMLRHAPHVWPTTAEIKLAFDVNNHRIVEFRQEVNEARRRREAAEAAATEERRKQKAEAANDALIEWQAAQRKKQRNKPSAAGGSTPDSRRPRPEVIDATAKDCLQNAIQAAADAGHAYIPNREALVAAVSKSLQYPLKVPSLFGTKERPRNAHGAIPGVQDSVGEHAEGVPRREAQQDPRSPGVAREP